MFSQFNNLFVSRLLLGVFFARGDVCVIVNVASKWGKTKVNYTQLAGMHASYAEKGLRILGFPCNQFGGQVTRIYTVFVSVAINTTHYPWTIGCLLNLFPNSLHFECCDLEHWILAYLRYIIKYIYLYYVKILYLIGKTHFCFSNLDFSCLYDLGARAWCRN